jgi:hypothetical protein
LFGSSFDEVSIILFSSDIFNLLLKKQLSIIYLCKIIYKSK